MVSPVSPHKKIRTSLTRALREADWLTDTDQPLVDLAYVHADLLDQAKQQYRDGELKFEDYSAYLHKSNGLASVLKDLGLAPNERKAILNGQVTSHISKVDELKKKRQQRANG